MWADKYKTVVCWIVTCPVYTQNNINLLTMSLSQFMFLGQPDQALPKAGQVISHHHQLITDALEREDWEKSQHSWVVTHPVEDQSHIASCHLSCCCSRAARPNPYRLACSRHRQARHGRAGESRYEKFQLSSHPSSWGQPHCTLYLESANSISSWTRANQSLPAMQYTVYIDSS